MLVGPSVCHNFLNGSRFTIPCSNRSTCLFKEKINEKIGLTCWTCHKRINASSHGIRSINFSICGKFPISDRWPTSFYWDMHEHLYNWPIHSRYHCHNTSARSAWPTASFRTAMSYLHIYYSFLFTDNNNFSRINSWCMPYIIFRENYKGIWISSAMAFMRVLVIQMYFC